MAADAININSILYRLYVRAPGHPAFAFSGRLVGDERANFGDVIGVTVDRANRLLLGHRAGIAVFDPKGTLTGTVSAQRAIGVLRGRGRAHRVRPPGGAA